MSRHSNRLALLDSEHRLQILQLRTNYANVAHDWLTCNMASRTLTIESNSKMMSLSSCVVCLTQFVFAYRT